MTASGQVLPHNRLSIAERIGTILATIPLPIVLSWALLKSPFSAYGRAKSWKRIIIDRLTLWVVSHSNRKQLRAFFGESRDTYNKYMKSKKLDPVVDELGEDARLLWLGEKKTEKVILVFHGGAYIFGMVESLPNFYEYVQSNLEKRGKSVSVALLNYSLIPDGKFPTQLKQAVLALQFLLDSGVKPENIQICGDSAGGIMIHQLLSHILHPLEGVPKVTLSSPLGGAYLMSPWATMRDDPTLHTNVGKGDMLTVPAGKYWASIVLDGVPEPSLPYIEANSAPEGWLEGVDKCVNRILISIGTAEVLRDSSIKYAKTVEKYHKETTILIDENGIHIDPFLSFLVKDKELGPVTPFLIDWLDKNYK